MLTPQGDIVNYNPSRRTIIVSSKSGEGKQMDDMLAQLTKTQQCIMEITGRLLKGLPKDALPPSAASITELRQMAAGVQNSNTILELIHSANTGRYIFEPTVHNKEMIVLKERLNGKELFPANIATEYAFFHLLLEHDPDRPCPIQY